MKRSIYIVLLALALILASFHTILAGTIRFCQPALTADPMEREPFQYQLTEYSRNQNQAVLTESEIHTLSRSVLRPREMNGKFRLLLVISLFLPLLYVCYLGTAFFLISRKLIHFVRKRILCFIQFTYGL